MIEAKGGDSWGNSGTGETPQWSEATEEAHRPPAGKRPPVAEINCTTILFKLFLLTMNKQDDRLNKVNEYSLWYKKELPASHLIDAYRC